MFEGSIPQFDSVESSGMSGLRRVEWAALVARLDAARELRRDVVRSARATGTPAAGSFSALSQVEVQDDSSIVNKIAGGVNPTILGHRKTDASKMLASTETVQTPSREQP
ncbi:hypothetical protein HKD42_10940 [Altererythrobacter sp. RZ02]|uniref:Uncharacterized protein n=1 Tax=Pontixanthobacter rizhaonensis TaxID=2730337 RepID=A0A848QPQ1_9SPHN|nr:hypothetical protein [Pontixanthobacter rizhaonensis]NMW32577.1 hypothetical protein [Pontixanthobacter rizhaonensis]